MYDILCLRSVFDDLVKGVAVWCGAVLEDLAQCMSGL